MRSKTRLLIAISALVLILIAIACQKLEQNEIEDSENETTELKNLQFSKEFDWQSTRIISLNFTSQSKQVIEVTSTDRTINYHKGIINASENKLIKISVPNSIKTLLINNEEYILSSDRITINNFSFNTAQHSKLNKVQNLTSDSDGDGIIDSQDDFPNDPDKAFLNYFPAAGYGSLAFEDLWPAKGDYDFNDLVVDYRFTTITNAQDYVVDIKASFVVKASGAFYANGFGFNLPTSKSGIEADLSISGYSILESYINLSGNGLEQSQSHPTVIVFDNIFNLLPHPGIGTGVNTETTAPFIPFETVDITLTPTQNTLIANDFNLVEWNPFIIVNMNRGVEVHLKDKTPTDLVDPSMFGTIDDDSDPGSNRYYVTTNNLPWAIDIPSSFDWPKEKIEISQAYLNFVDWAESLGLEHEDWYLDRPGYRNYDHIYIYPDSLVIPTTILKPVPNFKADHELIIEAETVQFTDQSTNTPTSWLWDFGDGSNSTEQNPAHAYSTKGEYTVSLTSTNQYGSNTITKTKYITVIRELEEGISTSYIDLDYYNGTIHTFNLNSGTVSINFTGSVPEIEVGDVFTVDRDTMGYLRKVISSQINGNTVTIETEQAYLTEIFIDKEFKLDTEIIPPNTQLKSTSTNREISMAFTDDNGFIHPAEIIYRNSYGQIIKKSALELSSTKAGGSVNIINYVNDFSDEDLYGEDGDPVHFYIDEGEISFATDAVLEFEFAPGFLSTDLESLEFYLKSEARFLTKLALDMSGEYTKEDSKKLFDVATKTVKFFVGFVPVWITLDCDIYGAYNFESNASLHADWGFESNHTLKVGAKYQSDNLSPILDYTPENIIYPLNINGEVNLEAKLEIYPTVDIALYSISGPYIDVVPYLSGNYNAAFQSIITTSGAENFLAWNSNLNVGLESRVGVKLDAIKKVFDIEDDEIGPEVFPIFEDTLWKAPHDLELLTNLEDQVEPGTIIPLTFKVSDLLDLSTPLCPVYISGDGTFSSEILITNLDGEVQLDWEIGSEAQEYQAMASIFTADTTKIDSIEFSVTAYEILQPIVVTSNISGIGSTFAVGGGSVNSNDTGGEWDNVTQKGICWSTSEDPTTSDFKTTNGSGDGAFVSHLTNLSPNTTYYVRAYATTYQGKTFYGTQKVFTTDP
ncbi:MAG: hypothetical protein CL663_02450 [Bacteroidetes bacterium]|nr:hypothetical protein [Bacteroidota bacterium]MBC34890.1 hypothetical protein [Bacteroidota bacterium]